MRSLLFAILFFFATPAYSHEIKPAIVDLIISDGIASIDFKINAEQVLANVDASIYQDTNDSPQAELYDQFRAKSEEDLKNDIQQNWNLFQEQISLKGIDEYSLLDLIDISTDPVVNIELPRDTNLSTQIALNENSFTVQFKNTFGPVVIRQFEDFEKENMIYSSYLQSGKSLRSSL